MVRLPILAYRYTLSPMIGHVCRFHPTCSVYALEAIDTHGAARGLWLTMKRLARCHPITWLGGSSGIDPVPPRKTYPPLEGGSKFSTSFSEEKISGRGVTYHRGLAPPRNLLAPMRSQISTLPQGESSAPASAACRSAYGE